MSLVNKQWTQAKTPADINLEGVDVELDWDGASINSIIIRDSNGNALRVIKGDYGGMRAMVPTTVEKYRLHGAVLGIDVNQTFDDEGTAEEHKSHILDALNSRETATIEIQKVRVPA